MVAGPQTPPVDLPTLRAQLAATLPGYALPQHVTQVDALPLRGPGKPDRAAVRALFAMGG